jgi:cell division protein FtsB
MNKNNPRKINFIKLLLNKYVVVFVIFVLYLTFFDDHNLISRFQRNTEISKLENDLNFYKSEIQADRDEIYKLLNDSSYLEKYARENYYMRKSDEDVFIFRDSVETEKE